LKIRTHDAKGKQLPRVQLCSSKWLYQTGVVACFGQNKVGKVGFF
jgi:hypothetical protein